MDLIDKGEFSFLPFINKVNFGKISSKKKISHLS